MAEVPASDAEMSPATQAPGAASEAAGAQAAGAQPAQGPAAPTTQMTPQELAAFANMPPADTTMEGLGKMFMHLSVQLQKNAETQRLSLIHI